MKYLLAAMLLLTAPALADDPNIDFMRGTCPYPAAAVAAKAEGATTVTYNGRANGTVDNVVVIQSSGNADLDKAAVDCVSHWRYDPNSVFGKHEYGPGRLTFLWRMTNDADGKFVGINLGKPHFCGSEYPPEARAALETGTVRVRFIITTQGTVKDVAVVTSSGFADLDTAALHCVADWRYRPKIENGKPVEIPWQAEIRWKLPDPQPPTTPPVTPPKP